MSAPNIIPLSAYFDLKMIPMSFFPERRAKCEDRADGLSESIKSSTKKLETSLIRITSVDHEGDSLFLKINLESIQFLN